MFAILVGVVVDHVSKSEASPWRFRLLPYSAERLSYAEIAAHRAAVFIPRVWYGKLPLGFSILLFGQSSILSREDHLWPVSKPRTFKDLITMEIPLFMPDLELQAGLLEV